MHNINLFVEDVAHKDFLTAIILRLANEYSVKIIVKPIIIFTLCSYVDFKHTINVRGAMNCATTDAANLK